MKTQSNVLYILRLTLTLLLITSVVAAALAGINTITEPINKQLNESIVFSGRNLSPKI